MINALLQRYRDWRLEVRIERQYQLYERGRDSEVAWSEMKRLIALRSPEQVARMERERGLA